MLGVTGNTGKRKPHQSGAQGFRSEQLISSSPRSGALHSAEQAGTAEPALGFCSAWQHRRRRSLNGLRMSLLTEARSASPAPRSHQRTPCPEPPSAASRAPSNTVLVRGLPPSHPGIAIPSGTGDTAEGSPPRRGAAPCAVPIAGRTNQRNARARQGTHRQVNRRARGSAGVSLATGGLKEQGNLLSRL